MFPVVTINVAQSLNGFVAGPEGKRVIISNSEDLERVDGLRATSDAILVGANTVMLDNPELSVRNHGGKKPLRVILDRRLRISQSSRVLDGTSTTLVYTAETSRRLENCVLVTLPDEKLTVKNILSDLYARGVRNLLVEGGPNVIRQFLEAGVYDRFFIFIGNIIIPEGGVPLFMYEKERRLAYSFVSTLGDGILIKLNRDSLL
ncbi:MAG: RibD family protein [Candidatus Thermoplasmatota archaeon]|nr:RibD family protein [Candidatus Thermoplasmatota archaeon]